MSFNLTPPPEMSGTTSAQLLSLRSYLFRMSEMLNASLNNLTQENFSSNTAAQISGSDTKTRAEISKQYDTLKALIIKTADIVRAEMDAVTAQLSSSYAASSEFGEFRQSMTNSLTLTAADITQLYELTEAVTSSADTASAAFETYKSTTSQYIKTGFLYNETVGGVTYPRYGLGVGENLTTITQDNEEIYNSGNLLATFTSDKLTFWINGTPQAYFQNKKLYVADIELTGKIIHGGWETGAANGYTIRWTGVE